MSQDVCSSIQTSNFIVFVLLLWMKSCLHISEESSCLLSLPCMLFLHINIIDKPLSSACHMSCATSEAVASLWTFMQSVTILGTQFAHTDTHQRNCLILHTRIILHIMDHLTAFTEFCNSDSSIGCNEGIHLFPLS